MDATCGELCTDTTSEESVTKFMYPEKEVARRKSSVFTRRSSVAFLDQEASCCSTSDDADDKRQVELEAYVEILRKEINDWKIMYKQRRDARKKATKQLNRMIVNEDLLGNLREDDKIFLANRPDYLKTGKDALSALQKLEISVVGTRDVEKSVSRVVEDIQVAASVMKKRIVEESFIQLKY